MISLERLCQIKIPDAELCRLIRAGSGVVQEQQQRVVAATLCGVAIGRSEQCIDL
jgi:hypothetical protein